MFVITIERDGNHNPIWLLNESFIENEADYLPLNDNDLPRYIEGYRVYVSNAEGQLILIKQYVNEDGRLKSVPIE